MRRSLVAGNWKLNGSLESVEALASGVISQMSDVSADVVLCPVFVHIDKVSKILVDTEVKLGAQDCSAYSDGAYTGEVSVEMLKEFSCGYVILGHSERRTLFSETDANVSEKMTAVLNAGLTPILCVGETLEEREKGDAEQVVERQLMSVLSDLSGELSSVVVAYEPVWAIGTGLTATPEQAQAMHAFIRSVLSKVSEDSFEKVRILYGGSVKPDNASDLFSQKDIDGGLIGGASLKVDDFVAICKAAG